MPQMKANKLLKNHGCKPYLKSLIYLKMNSYLSITRLLTLTILTGEQERTGNMEHQLELLAHLGAL